MKPLYLVSDIHAGDPAGAEGLRDFLDFLSFLEKREGELYILGDLFDFWFEWRHVVPKGVFNLLYRLRRLVDAGWPVTFLNGNHDFFSGPFLQREVGLICAGGSCILERGGRRFFLAHGDGMAKRDRGYRVLKRVLHNSISQAAFRHLVPADWGMSLARTSSRGSRRYRRIDRTAWSADYLEAARTRFKEGFDVVALGHVHEPMIFFEGEHIYVNCGDWLTHRSCVLVSENVPVLADWSRDPGRLQVRPTPENRPGTTRGGLNESQEN